MELNHTCLELLKILYDQQDYVTIGDLAEQLGKQSALSDTIWTRSMRS